jgi:anaerobic selenocysteine-containing dehydrogenase
MILVGCPRDCYDTCRLRVYVEGGRITKIEASDDMFTQGVLCPRAAKDVERVYSPFRVLYPAVNIGRGVFKRVDWDSALDVVVSRLREVLEVYGVEKVLFLENAGNRGILTRYASRRLWNFLGVTQTDRSICDFSGTKALKLVYGSTYGIFPNDIDKVNMVVVWGFNPAVSAIHLWRKILGVRERGGTIATIDVRFTETARQSTEFIRVKPGSDGYLALGIARYLVEKGYIDKGFIDRYTQGFEELVKHLESYSLDLVEEVTGVSKNKIAEFAEELASQKPFAIFIGYGLQRRYGGGEIVRSIAVIPALIGMHRGFYYSNTDGLPINFVDVESSKCWGPRKIISMERIGEEIYRGNYKFVYIHLHNPAATLPNVDRFVSGLKREDVFVVVHETHWSDTARLADVVLPAPTFYEKLDAVFSYSHSVVYLNKPAIEPLWESLGEYQLMCEIAKRIAPSNYSELCPDPYEVFRAALGDKVFKKLVEEGSAELEPKPRDVYQTPSGKIELYSIGALEEGLPPLPTPPKGDRVGENELLLITSAHPLYTHTQFEEVYGSIYSDLLINPEDAKQLNIETGNLVEVYNEKGAVKLKIRVDPSLGKGIAWLPRHSKTYNGKRINVIIDDGIDSYGGATLNSTHIRIRKIQNT